MTPKQEYEFGITKEFLYDQYHYENGKLYKTGYLHIGHVEVGWFDKSAGYHRIQIGGETWMLYRLIWIWHFGEIPKGMTIDHKDHDKTNNRIENLRLATRSEQNKFQRKRKGCSSQYIGVHWRERAKKFEVYVNTYTDGVKKSKYLGSYTDEIIAAKVRDKYIEDNLLTEWNLLNFPTGVRIREGEWIDDVFYPSE